MHSPDDARDSGNARDAVTSVQNTLDAFEGPVDEDGERMPSREATPSMGTSHVEMLAPDLRQESIDTFSTPHPKEPSQEETVGRSRAMEGLALEMEIERVALTEASAGITRDELLITIAREVKVPLEDLDLVDAYLTDLELEGRIRRVGDVVVLPYPEDDDLMAMDLGEREFIARYRRRHLTKAGGGDG